MKRTIIIVLIVLLSSALYAQDDPDIVSVPVEGLPVPSRVIAYAAVPGRTADVLVAEIETSDGTTAFYLFDYIDDVLRARVIGPRLIPGDLSAPPAHQPETARLSASGERFWRVAGSPTDSRADQLVGAPSLDSLRFMEVGQSPWQLSPPPRSALTIQHFSLAADGGVVESCVLEPNLTAATDRVTTSGAWWVEPFGEAHLLVGFLFAGPGRDRYGSLRLYTSDFEVVAATLPEIEVDANSVPALVRADLSGDGEDELLFFATAGNPDRPIVVYRFARRSGARRILAFSLCSVRMNGVDVAELQRTLAGRGFWLGPHGIDGWYGPDTRAAVVRFQREAGVPVSGIVDATVWRLLGF